MILMASEAADRGRQDVAQGMEQSWHVSNGVVGDGGWVWLQTRQWVTQLGSSQTVHRRAPIALLNSRNLVLLPLFERADQVLRSLCGGLVDLF